MNNAQKRKELIVCLTKCLSDNKAVRHTSKISVRRFFTFHNEIGKHLAKKQNLWKKLIGINGYNV